MFSTRIVSDHLHAWIEISEALHSWIDYSATLLPELSTWFSSTGWSSQSHRRVTLTRLIGLVHSHVLSMSRSSKWWKLDSAFVQNGPSTSTSRSKAMESDAWGGCCSGVATTTDWIVKYPGEIFSYRHKMETKWKCHGKWHCTVHHTG